MLKEDLADVFSGKNRAIPRILLSSARQLFLQESRPDVRKASNYLRACMRMYRGALGSLFIG